MKRFKNKIPPIYTAFHTCGMGIVSYMNTQTGFQSFYLESDVLKAEMATKASACESFEQITEQFHQKLVGKECDVYGTYLPWTRPDTPQMGGM